jgi:hypothetical protein
MLFSEIGALNLDQAIRINYFNCSSVNESMVRYVLFLSCGLNFRVQIEILYRTFYSGATVATLRLCNS